MIRKCLAQLAALPADPPLDEPRAFTVADLLTLIAGAAAGFGVVLPRGGFEFEEDSFFDPPFLIFLACVLILWSLVLATTGVILRRQIVYRRLPHPAEWLAILIAAIPILFAADSPSTLAKEMQLFPSAPRLGALFVAIAALAVVLVFLALVRATSRVIPAWVSTLVILASAISWLWGPASLISDEIPNIRPGTDGWTSESLLWLYVNGTNHLASVPIFIVFGIPSVTALAARRTGQRRWIWTEKLSLGMGLVLLLGSLAVVYLSDWLSGRMPTIDDRIEQIITPITILTIAAVSGLLLRVWRRIAPAS